MPKVSIIIPALNSIRYLRECMDSVVNQTLRDIEIIPVDAGSTDGTWELFQEYAAKDPRVKPLHSDRKSMGYQYNMGIAAATGDYIGFVETDDYIALDMYETLYNAIDGTNADWVKSNFRMFVDLGDERLFVSKALLPPELKHLYGDIIQPLSLSAELSNRNVNIWNGIYSKSFFDKWNIRFNDSPGAAFQDSGAVIQTMVFADKLILLDVPLYNYRCDNYNSSSHNIRTAEFTANEFEYILNVFDKHKMRALPWRPYYHTRMSGLFKGMLQKGVFQGECPAQHEELIRRFASLLERNLKYMPLELQSWAQIYSQTFLYLIANDIDQLYKLIYTENILTERQFKAASAHLRAYPQVIIFGAGEQGSCYYLLMRIMGVNNMLCFCDNDKSKWGETIMNLPVCAPDDAIEKYPDSLFVVANAKYYTDIIYQLIKSGVAETRIYKAEWLSPETAAGLVLSFGRGTGESIV